MLKKFDSISYAYFKNRRKSLAEQTHLRDCRGLRRFLSDLDDGDAHKDEDDDHPNRRGLAGALSVLGQFREPYMKTRPASEMAIIISVGCRIRQFKVEI